MARIRCFLMEPTGRVIVHLRRYRSSNAPDENHCSHEGNGGYHQAMTRIADEPEEHDAEGYVTNSVKPTPPHDDPRWPLSCACGYEFRESDAWQRFVERLYRRTDTGEELLLRDAPAGAMWKAWWVDRFHVPQGEHNLVVKTPGGDWEIDSQASNCTMKDDVRQEKHHCWIRHGNPPDITVDKNGVTCGAGAGSIQAGNYHGFLRNGYLED